MHNKSECKRNAHSLNRFHLDANIYTNAFRMKWDLNLYWNRGAGQRTGTHTHSTSHWTKIKRKPVKSDWKSSFILIYLAMVTFIWTLFVRTFLTAHSLSTSYVIKATTHRFQYQKIGDWKKSNNMAIIYSKGPIFPIEVHVELNKFILIDSKSMLTLLLQNIIWHG